MNIDDISAAEYLEPMRILLTATLPHHEFNTAVRDGTVAEKLRRILDDLKPEATYFTNHDGMRSAVLVLDLADASKIPSVAEPWFLLFNAEIDIRVVMEPEDLAKAGLDELGKKWG